MGACIYHSMGAQHGCHLQMLESRGPVVHTHKHAHTHTLESNTRPAGLHIKNKNLSAWEVVEKWKIKGEGLQVGWHVQEHNLSVVKSVYLRNTAHTHTLSTCTHTHTLNT